MPKKSVHSKNDSYYLYEQGIIVVNGKKRRRCDNCSKWYNIDGTFISICGDCFVTKKAKEDEEKRDTDAMFSKEEMRKDIEQFFEMNKEYFDEKREQRNEWSRIGGQRYRARKRSLLAEFTAEDWNACLASFDNRCAYCGKKRKLAQEHFIPVSKGGHYTVDNMLPACKSCNSSKNDRDFSEWYPNYAYYSADRVRKIIEYLQLAPS
jgi:5-methylcytosine-specific restriction endonuclease McrA